MFVDFTIEELENLLTAVANEREKYEELIKEYDRKITYWKAHNQVDRTAHCINAKAKYVACVDTYKDLCDKISNMIP
jgi:hypothetical protein